MADAPTPRTQPASVGRIAAAAVGAFLVAALVFVGAVLPAEYGTDPLGTGELLGLLALAQVAAISAETGEYRLDAAELVVRPSEWVEYTYRIEQGASMLYSWEATGPVSYNFHSAPDGRRRDTPRASTPRKATRRTAATTPRSPACMGGIGRTSARPR